MKLSIARVLGIVAIFASVIFVSSLLVTKVSADDHHNDNQDHHNSDNGPWSDPNSDKWSVCVQTECGSDKGTQTQTLTCIKDKHDEDGKSCDPGKWIDDKKDCPTDQSLYTSHDDNKDCKSDHEIDGHYLFTDKVVTDPGHYETQPETTVISRDCTVRDVTACPVTPVQPPTSNGGGPGDGLSDGRSDGRSDGLSSCPSCTAPPKTSEQVLGASTDFANTGVADDMIANVVGVMGGVSTASGLVLAAKKKFRI